MPELSEKKIEIIWKQQYGEIPTAKNTVTHEQYQLFKEKMRKPEMPSILVGEAWVIGILILLAVLFVKLIKEIYQEYS